jgi:hypothetical protein
MTQAYGSAADDRRWRVLRGVWEGGLVRWALSRGECKRRVRLVRPANPTIWAWGLQPSTSTSRWDQTQSRPPRDLVMYYDSERESNVRDVVKKGKDEETCIVREGRTSKARLVSSLSLSLEVLLSAASTASATTGLGIVWARAKKRARSGTGGTASGSILRRGRRGAGSGRASEQIKRRTDRAKANPRKCEALTLLWELIGQSARPAPGSFPESGASPAPSGR